MAANKKSLKITETPKAPQKHKILITSALPYVNNVPHLGNIIGCVLSADVFARFCRLKGHETLYICGTDEHGTATETKALEEGLTPKQICDKYHRIHKEIYEWFGCSFDCFGRTSIDTHTEVTQDLFLQLNKNGYITKNRVEQLFCGNCSKFLADRFVGGSCPHCGYAHARGDQCDRCGHLLNAIELQNPKCKICGSKPEIRESEHLFLDLKKLSPYLKAWFEKRSAEGFWTQNAIRATDAWFREGLKERCITRDLRWGVPVPLKGYEDKVFYVWFDAPIGYISIAKHMIKGWNAWWLNDSVRLYQFMAKDNIPFHTILFPAALIGAKRNYALLYHIDSTEYLNYEDGKFSKSLKQGVFGDDAVSTGIPPDVWRYYLLTNRPENSDTQFSWKDFQEKNNNELLANLGNFVNRTLVFIKNNFDSIIPGEEMIEKDRQLINHIDGQIDKISGLMENVKIKDSLRETMHITKLANQYFQENEPWVLIKTDRKRCGTVINVCANIIKNMAVVIMPFLPFTSSEIFRQLNIDRKEYEKYGWGSSLALSMKKGHKISDPKPLFRKLEDKEIDALRNKFKGRQIENKNGKHAKENQNAEHKANEEDPFLKLDLRIAKIEKVEDHPDAERLYVMQISLGETGKRQICAGLRNYYSKEQLLGRKIVVAANLKPAKLRGMDSQGMLLAGSNDQKHIVKILDAENCGIGEHVFAEGMKEADEHAGKDVKKEIGFGDFEKAKMIVKEGRILYNGKELRTKSGRIKIFGLNDGVVG